MNELMMFSLMGQSLWIWLAFFGVVISLLVFDLGVLHKDQHEISVRESLSLTCAYVTAGLLFSVWVYYLMGLNNAIDYVTGFLIEKSLSLDNIFVIALIFHSLKIPRKYQHRVLFWGIIGVFILRGLMIFAGAALVQKFEWILYIFSIFMIFSGIKLFFSVHEEDADLESNRLIMFIKNHIRLTHELEGQKFFVRKKDQKSGKILLYGTPLLLTLISIETADVIFAVDSVPAIFTITSNTFVIYTSNIFAILGLRALYFTLAAMLHKFDYLKYALSLVLIFIGSKIFIADFWHYEISSLSSLAVICLLLGSGVAYSLYKGREN